MLKRYKNYIISSDNEEEDNNINRPNNNLINKEKYILKNKEKITNFEGDTSKNINLINSQNNDKKYHQKFFEGENNEYNKNIKNNYKEDNRDFKRNKEEEKQNIKKIIYCEICDKRLENRENYLLHMSSKRHKYKMKELLKNQLKKYGSVKKVLIKEKMISPCRRWRINNARYLLYGFALNRYLNK